LTESFFLVQHHGGTSTGAVFPTILFHEIGVKDLDTFGGCA